MAHRLLAVIAAITLVATSSVAFAQSDAAPKASGMKGSPNANGYGDERGMDKSDAMKSAPAEKGSDERPATKEMDKTPK